MCRSASTTRARRIANLCTLDCTCLSSPLTSGNKPHSFMHDMMCVRMGTYKMYTNTCAGTATTVCGHHDGLICILQQAKRVYSDSKSLSAHRRVSATSLSVALLIYAYNLCCKALTSPRASCTYASSEMYLHTSLARTQQRSCIHKHECLPTHKSSHLLRGLDMLTRL